MNLALQRRWLADLLSADEEFSSSSVREILPLVEIDGQDLGRGPAADVALSNS